MGYYKTPEEMFSARADKYQKQADQHWAKAKSGGHPSHYHTAKELYKKAEENRAKAVNAKTSWGSFQKGGEK